MRISTLPDIQKRIKNTGNKAKKTTKRYRSVSRIQIDHIRVMLENYGNKIVI